MEPQEYATLPLTETEVRVLGCLVEKEATTPDHSPLTLNALVAACNQKSNRSPTMSLDDRTVVRALDKLRDKKLALMLTGASNRVPKYAHTLGKAFPVDPAQSAVLCVLMLRGPQTLGEIKSRCERLHRIANRIHVDINTTQLASFDDDTIRFILNLASHLSEALAECNVSLQGIARQSFHTNLSATDCRRRPEVTRR